MELRDAIIEIIDECIEIEDMETDTRDGNYSCSFVGFETAADRILAIPKIAEALAVHGRVIERTAHLGHSISTNTREGD